MTRRHSPVGRATVLHLALFAAAALSGLPSAAAAEPTVCTITVNSADEKEALRRHLPPDRYRFVELVERGRPDWLASACRAAIACDVLVISAHYDGGNEFFSDQPEAREFLTVDELERVSCSDSCPALFARLKEVYLFGCNTLNPTPQSCASDEIVRSLIRDGYTRPEAERERRALAARHCESSRDRIRQVFKGVPVIYGFPARAPLGPVAAATLSRYLRAAGDREFGRGQPSHRLLDQFAPYPMSVTEGLGDQGSRAGAREEMCRFVDDRTSTAQKLRFVHELLQGPMAEVRMHLDRIRRLVSALDARARQTPEVARALQHIAGDGTARQRFLAFARDADQPAVRVRMLRVARDLDWLSDGEWRNELALTLDELQSRTDLGLSAIYLACTLNEAGELDGAFGARDLPRDAADTLVHAAVRACLGSPDSRARVLQALASPDDAQVQIAQAYLRFRPIAAAGELRHVAAGIVAMRPSAAQVRALEALGRHYVSDPAILQMLTRLYSETTSWQVQAAVAGVLIRADRRSIAGSELLRTLTRDRLPSPAEDNMIDALIDRLQSP